MKRTIKVIAEMGCDENKALLIEMPQDMIQGLKVYPNGEIDTKCLIGMLMLLEQESDLIEQEGGLIPEQLDLMLNVFDSSKAADFSHRAA